ncbi:LysE family translocator [Sphingomonas sp. HMP9]|uniref:LysE family translocator n=1 Tax=Sphingomonas sp. HMP9 TaxID=1517554 RepID=UPI002F96CDA6
MTRSIAFGVWRSIATMAGCLTALVLVLSASAAGMGAVLVASPELFAILRYLGATYLLYLGVKAWRAPVEGKGPDHGAVAFGSALRLYRNGLVVGLSNPKLLLFAAAFLPQFVDQRGDAASQFTILIATFAVIETSWMTCYSFGGRSIALFLTKPARQRFFNRVTGSMFTGFGVVLAFTKA